MCVRTAQDVRTPTAPESLFEFLESDGAELVKVKGRDACCVPFVSGPMFVTSLGKLVCRHGATRRSLLKRRQYETSDRASKRLPKCSCELGVLPLHTGLKGVRLGKYAECKPVVVAPRAAQAVAAAAE